jgi:hypothetical protein
MMHDHILERGAAFREGGAALRALSNTVKAWLIVYHECVAIAGLPGKERRAELEKLTWDAVKKAHESIQTEEAAKKARNRILLRARLRHDQKSGACARPVMVASYAKTVLLNPAFAGLSLLP